MVIIILAMLVSCSRTSVRSPVRTLVLIFRITTLGLEAASSIRSDGLIPRALRAYVSSLRKHPLSLLLSKTIAMSPLGSTRVAIPLVLFGILAIALLIRLIKASIGIRFSYRVSLVLRIASGAP